jgi:Spy/CpxP family protein refolding chaperone
MLAIMAAKQGGREMRKYAMGILAVLLAAGFSTQVTAAPATSNPANSPRPALTQDEIAKRKADREAIRAAMTTQRAQMKNLTDQLRAELKKKPVDKNKVDALTKQIDIQRDTVRVQHMQMIMDHNPNLKPEQKKRYGDMIQKAKDRLAKKQTAK